MFVMGAPPEIPEFESVYEPGNPRQAKERYMYCVKNDIPHLLLEDGTDKYHVFTDPEKVFLPNTFLISIRMHSTLDSLFNYFTPEFIYSPFVPKKLFSPNMTIVKVQNGDIGTCTETVMPVSEHKLQKYNK
jgi:hypothetical protein